MATGAGVLFALDWRAAAIGAGVWLLAFLAFRYVSLGSIVAAVGVAAAGFWTGPLRWGEEALPVSVFCVLLAVVVILRHRENIRRLIRGEERQVCFRRSHEAR